MSRNPYGESARLLITSLLTTLLGIKVGEMFLYLGNSFLTNPIILFIIAILLLLATGAATGGVKRILFHLFALVEGVMLAPTMLYYLKIMPQTLMTAVVVTIILIGIFLIVGHYAKNLSIWGSYLFVGLLGLLVFSLVNIFIPIPFLVYFGLILFCGYIAYDINCFKRRVSMTGGQMAKEEITTHVVNQYLNIINLFTHVLEALRD